MATTDIIENPKGVSLRGRHKELWVLRSALSLAKKFSSWLPVYLEEKAKVAWAVTTVANPRLQLEM